jgi:peptidyl-prolyl cis-trans isomerase D
MLHFVRSFTGSRFGTAVALIVLVIIAFAFAAGDMAGMQGFGSTGGGTVAKVGNRKIDTNDLSQAANNALDGLKQQDPRLTMPAFVAQGGLGKVLDEMIARTALTVFGARHGIVASDRLIDSEITKIPAFRGLDGKFSETVFRQLLAQRRISEAAVRQDLAQELIVRQIVEPASFGATMPEGLALRYATLLRERREGAIALLPAPLFAPKAPPSDKEVADYYASHKNRFIRPERRVIRYASFGEEALKPVAPPTDAQIAARYNADKALYAASEQRRLTRLVVPTEAAARAVLAETAKGKSLDVVASEKGLETSKVGPVDKAGLAASAGAAVADAAFAAASGSFAGPARSAIGWDIVHVDAVEKRPARSLDQVRGEIAAQLTALKRRAALNDLTARIEDEFDNGGNLSDAAKDLGITLHETPPLTADGKVYEHADQAVAPVLAKVVPTAFSMDKEGEPQLAEIEAGKTFVIFDVSRITPSAVAPLAEIKPDVTAALTFDRGTAAAKTAADKLLAETRKGKTLAQAVAALGVALPPVQAIAMNREELMRQGQRPPAPLLLLFSMAKGTTKILPAPGGRGWFVIALKDIVTQPIAPKDPLVPQAQHELGELAGNEYADSLARAIRAEVKVERNDKAFKTVHDQLAGIGN